jgi:hypothetical protein
MSHVHVELLIGRTVVDAEGRSVGRIEEIVASEVDGECRVLEYHLGTFGALERIGASGRVAAGLLKAFVPHTHRACAVSWDRMDLSDPMHPRVTVRREALPEL